MVQAGKTLPTFPLTEAHTNSTVFVQTFIKPKADLDAGDENMGDSSHGTTTSAGKKAQVSTEDDDMEPEQMKTPCGHKREV